MDVPGDELTRTYDCKTPHCDRPARSSRGLYAYCDECRARRAGDAPAKPKTGGLVEHIRELEKEARAADKLADRARCSRPAVRNGRARAVLDTPSSPCFSCK